MSESTSVAPPLRPAPRGEGSLARSGLISFVGAIAAAVLGFALTVLISRVLGASGAGLFFTVAALFFILSNAVELGADTALVWDLPRLRALRRPAELRSTVRIALAPVWVASAASAVALFVLAPDLAAILVDLPQQQEAVLWIQLVAPFLVIAAPLTVALAGTRGLGSVIPFTLVSSIGVPLARPLLILVVVAAGLGGTAVLLAWATPLVVAAAVAFAILARQVHRHEAAATADDLPARPLRAQAREFWGYATPRCFSAILEIALVWVDVLLVAALSTTRLAGIYAAASRFITTGTLVEGALRVALGPRLSTQLAVGDRRGAERLQETATVWIVALSWPIYLTLAVYGSVLLRLFGDEFVDGAPALAILAFAMAFAMAAGLAQTVLLMSGKAGWQLGNKVVALVLNIVLNLLLVPRYGLEGAAVAWAASILFDAVAAVVEVRFVVGLRFAARRLVPVMLASAACFGGGGLLVRAIAGDTVLSLLAYGVLASMAYAGVLWAIRRRLDLHTVLEGLRRRRSGGQPQTDEPRTDEPLPKP